MRTSAVRGAIGRAVLAAGAIVVLLSAPVGVAAAAAGPPVLAFQAAPSDYGQVPVGKRVDQTFTLKNTGDRASGALVLSVTGSTAFTITGDTCPPSLGPGKTCTVLVRFAPIETGTATSTLTAVNKRGTVAARAGLTGSGSELGTTYRHLYFSTTDGNINTSTLDGSFVFNLANGQHKPSFLAANGGAVYWAETNNGAVNFASFVSSGVVLLIGNQNLPFGVALDATHVYWTNEEDGTVNKVFLDGGFPTTPLFSNQDFPRGIAVNAGIVYWATRDGTIKQAPVTGGTITTLTTDSSVVGLAVDSTNIYWTTGVENGDVKAYPLAGGKQSVLVSGQNQPYGVAVTDTQIFFSNLGDSTLKVAPLAGGTPKTLLTMGAVGVAVGP